MWEERDYGAVKTFVLPPWEEKGVSLWQTTRLAGESGGVYESLNLALHVGDEPSTVVANRRRFLRAVDGPANFVTTQQTHSNHILCVDQQSAGRGFLRYDDAFADCDGLVTATPGLLLATFYADCLPLACFDPQQRALGMAHAGWQGTWQNIGGALVAMMQSCFCSQPQQLLFAVGAGIGPCCYEVDRGFYDQFKCVYGQADRWFTPKGGDHYFFDNVAANLDLLTGVGVLPEHIEVLDRCTCCRQDLFYSYRGSGGTTGRQGLFAQLHR